MESKPKKSKPGANKYSKRPQGKKPFRGKGGKPYRGGNKKKKVRIPSEARMLAQEHNLPAFKALLVYKGKASLEDVLKEQQEKEERKKKAKEICKQYPSIDLALACLLVKEGMSAEDFFAAKKEREEKKKEKDLKKKERMRQDESQQKAFNLLSEFVEKQQKIVLATYDKDKITGVLKEFTPYDFLFQSNNTLSKIHRLELKYMYEKEQEEGIDKLIMVDKEIQKKKHRPSHGPEGRFQFPEGVLGKGNQIMLALHQGEMIRGTIEWFTPYDIMLKVGSKDLWVFRHAVLECTILKKAPQPEEETSGKGKNKNKGKSKGKGKIKKSKKKKK